MRYPPSHERHTSRRIGVLVAVAVGLFLTALLQAGVLQDLFRDRLQLRVELPESGLSGLSTGAAVEVLGTEAGQVTDVVLQTDGPFYAEVALAREMKPFVRRDSTAEIRKRFGIAGSSYLHITRGTGEPLDWDYAVIQAQSGPAPTESMNDLLADLRNRVFPVIDDAKRTIQAIAQLSDALAQPEGDFRTALANLERVTGAVASGEGTAGRLITDDRAARQLERAIGKLNDNLDQLGRVVDNLESGSGDLAAAAANVRDPDNGLPAALKRANASLRALQQVLDGASKSMPAVRKTLDNTAGASENVPNLLIRTEATLSELNGVLEQLRRSWLLGGADGEGAPRPISPVREQEQ